MLGEKIVPQSEVITAILLEDSPWCGDPHRIRVGGDDRGAVEAASGSRDDVTVPRAVVVVVLAVVVVAHQVPALRRAGRPVIRLHHPTGRVVAAATLVPVRRRVTARPRATSRPVRPLNFNTKIRTPALWHLARGLGLWCCAHYRPSS